MTQQSTTQPEPLLANFDIHDYVMWKYEKGIK